MQPSKLVPNLKRQIALLKQPLLVLGSAVACSNLSPLLEQPDRGGAGAGIAGFSYSGARAGQGGGSGEGAHAAPEKRPPAKDDSDEQHGGGATSDGGAAGSSPGDEAGAPATDGNEGGGSGGVATGSGAGFGGLGSGGAASGGTFGGSSGRAGSAGSGARGGSGGTSPSGRGGTGASGGATGGTGAASGGRGGTGASGGATSGTGGHAIAGAGGGGPLPRDLVLSEYVEGSKSYKALEIRSETATYLDGCELATYSNGNVTAKPAARIALDGALDAGGVHVLCSKELAALLGSACDREANLSFNGNDAVALECEGVVLDVLGQIGVDPGDAWRSGEASTLNQTLRRRCGSLADPLASDAFDPSAGWLALPTDTFDGLGDPACE